MSRRAASAATSPARNPLGLSPLEISAGWVNGTDASAADPRRQPPLETAVAALEAAMRPALAAGRCHVAFSGGRDSSTLLAIATELARREGFEPPVPLTLRWPAAPGTFEDDWQERVVDHLGLHEWKIVEIHDELDLLGPIATAALRRHGLLWPPTAIIGIPLVEAAAGGSLIVGEGGDEVFGGAGRGDDLRRVIARRRLPSARDALKVAITFAPRPVRAEAIRRRAPAHQRWLRPDAYRAYNRLESDGYAGEPLTWPAYLSWVSRLRYVGLIMATWRRYAGEYGTGVVYPYWDPTFLSTLARLGGRWGFGSRDRAMVSLFGDVLPHEVLTRTTKADAGEPLFSGHSRRFAEQWDGSGVDPLYVDPEALRAVWLRPRPFFGCTTLLHTAWLAQELGEAW